MCAPAIIALAGSAVQMKQQMDAADFESAVADNNANLAYYQATNARQRGAAEARDVGLEASKIEGQAKVAIESAGIDSTSGSAKNVIAASNMAAAKDQERIRAKAAMEAWGFRNEEQELRARGKMAKETGYLGALGTGLGGAGQAAGYYAQSKKSEDG